MTLPVSNKTEIKELMERVKAAIGPDRQLDRDIGLAIGGWSKRTYEGIPMIEAYGDWYPDHPGSMYPSPTESIDDALALVERVRPGWNWQIERDGCTMWKGDTLDEVVIAAEATAPLAILAALLLALEEDGE